jgi:transcriptional regulator with XRE-family HTH domain
MLRQLQDLSDQTVTDNLLVPGKLGPMSSLAERLQWVLDHRGLTAHALSKKAGLAGGHVGLIITGKAGKRTAGKTLEQIAKAANVSLQWLATGQGTPDAAPQEPAAPVPVLAADQAGPLELALGRAFNWERHQLRDANAVMRALGNETDLARTDVITTKLGYDLLEEAASLRTKGMPVTAGALLIHHLASRPSADDLKNVKDLALKRLEQAEEAAAAESAERTEHAKPPRAKHRR